MKQGKFEIIENIPLAKDIMRLRLGGDTGAIVRPGQFRGQTSAYRRGHGLYASVRPGKVPDKRG